MLKFSELGGATLKIHHYFSTLLVLLIFTNTLYATNYYIDGTNGYDSNNGLTPATAWKTLSKINNNSSFAPGDIIAIRDSIRYEGGIFFTASGSDGIHIKITNWYGSASERKPVIKASNTVNNFVNVSGNIWRASYVPSTGQINQVWFEGDQDDATQTVWGVKETSVGNLNADNEWYWSSNELYIYSTSDPGTRYDYVEADCQTAWNKIYPIFEQGNYVTVEDLDVRYGNAGGIRIGNSGSNNVTIQDCKTSFTGLRSTESAHGIISYNGINIIIRRNECLQNSNHGIYVFANDANRTSENIYVDSNTVYDNKHSQIDINTNGGHLDSIVCRYNLLYNSIGNWIYTEYGSTPDGFFIAGQSMGSTSHVYLISNVIINIYGGAVDIDHSNIDSLYIYNNTIYNNFTGSTSTKALIYMINDTNMVDFRNNLLYSIGTKGLVRLSNLNNKHLNYNLYFWANSVTNPFYYNGIKASLSDWQAATGQESNSLNADPHFQNAIGDLRVDLGSQAIDKGIAIQISSKDKNGISRPQGNKWDIGAYEFLTSGGSNNPPNVPSNPNPANGSLNQYTNLTLSWNCTDPEGDPLTYDVYFGTTNNPTLISGNQLNASYNPGQLNTNTTYFWKIVAKDNQGVSTAGPVWNFSTEVDTGSGGDTTSVNVDTKIFLEGPYIDNLMATDLASNSLIPNDQPYNVQPWNYSGNEHTSSIPQNIVDWILIELRSGTGASTVVGRRAALLRNDGIIVDLNGGTQINFPDVYSGQYYIVIYHRNHLAIMSKNSVSLNHSSPLYDFTISEDQAYGNQPLKVLSNGKFGLYAADGNSNGSVNNSDYNSVWKRQNGSLGYENGDFDLNGGVNISDRNDKWKPNTGKSSQVP